MMMESGAVPERREAEYTKPKLENKDQDSHTANLSSLVDGPVRRSVISVGQGEHV